MKIIIILILFFYFISFPFAQETSFHKSHLFLGTWQLDSEKDLFEIWSFNKENVYSGKVIHINGFDSTMIENLRLLYVNDTLKYCATVKNQNEGREIIFALKEIQNNGYKFIFENPEHLSPHRIVYDFSENLKMKVTVESIANGKNKTIYYSFTKIPSDNDIAVFSGYIKKEQFVNKGRHIIENVFDYFFVIEGTPYFIKFSGSDVSITGIKEFEEHKLRLKIKFLYGMWDSDDETHQSRIGKYINVLEILN